MINFSVIQIQACVRGHLAKCLHKRSKQEREKELEQQKMTLQNVAATAIVSKIKASWCFISIMLLSSLNTTSMLSFFARLAKKCTLQQTCFRGYQDFVRFVIIQYFVIKIQACIRGNQSRCRLRPLKREDSNKKIKKNKELSDVMSRVSSAHMKKNRPRVAGDVSLSSLCFSSNQKKHIPIGRVLQEQREKKAALIIERFFIQIRAEIELEITRLEQKKLRSKRKKARRKKNGSKDLGWNNQI